MFVADLHNDVLQRSIIGEDISVKTNQGHSDLIRLKNSCIDFEVFVIWITGDKYKKSAFNRAIQFYDEIESLEKKNEFIKITNNVDDIILAKKNNKLALSISLEGGEAIEDNIENLHYFINRGLFYFGPTWNNSLSWVSSAYDETCNKKNIISLGLNNFGKEVIKTCNENNILIDVSHIGERSFWDIAEISTKPFIASHSSVFKLCPHFRNLKDDQILCIKNKEGLIGLNPYPFFIDPNFKVKENKYRIKFLEEMNNMSSVNQDPIQNWIVKQHFLQKKLQSIAPSIDIFIDHIEYIIKLAGIDFVAVGSDYDGLDCLPKEMSDCLDHFIIYEKLESRGYTTYEIEKVMGLNLIRVLEANKK